MKISDEIYESPTASSKLEASEHVFCQVLGLPAIGDAFDLTESASGLKFDCL